MEPLSPGQYPLIRIYHYQEYPNHPLTLHFNTRSVVVGLYPPG